MIIDLMKLHYSKFKKQMKTLLLFTISLFFGFLSYAQEGSKAVLNGTIIDAEKNGISEVLIVLKLKNKEISRLITPSSGKFDKLNIPIGDVYTIIISRINLCLYILCLRKAFQISLYENSYLSMVLYHLHYLELIENQVFRLFHL
jgi:hypothetical protein